jgi:single-strand DNA-binding protein
MNDGMNRVILLGNVGAEPELKYTPGGVAILRFRLATNESYLDKNKEHQERTEWHTVIVWGARAEGLSRVLAKGSAVLVEGGLRTTSYDKEGQKHYRTEVHARDLCFAGRRAQSPDASGLAPLPSDEGAATPVTRANGHLAARKPEALEELPF